MSHIYRSIHDVLVAWGKHTPVLPPGNDALKQEVLNRFVSTPASRATRPELPRRIPWLALAFSGFAVIVFFLSPSRFIPLSPGLSSVADKLMSKPMSLEYTREYIPDFVPPMEDGTVPDRAPRAPITDRREFMKTDYHARLRSRDVTGTWQRAQTLVRGTGGRVDAANLGQRYGYIAFAVPVEKFAAFRDELRALAPWARFFTEDISSQNFLPEKRGIESRTDQVMKDISRFRDERESLQRIHQRTINTLQSRLKTVAIELTKLRGIVTDDPEAQAKNSAREQAFIKEESDLRARLERENSAYARKISVLAGQINAAEAQANQLAEQGQTLRDTVATVAGTISIDWISVWQILALYLGGYWLSLLLLLAATTTYWRHRRGQEIILP